MKKIKNHSSSYIEDRLKELELIADELIQFALWRWEKNPKEKDDILKETEEYLNQRIGQGSIGPATAAAGLLLLKKVKKLQQIFQNRYYK